jgi:hypothetical protein
MHKILHEEYFQWYHLVTDHINNNNNNYYYYYYYYYFLQISDINTY